MQYPLISEYVRAMQDPAGNLDQLAHLVPVLDDHGEPMRSSGAFAVVFKMKDESTGKGYALKCFTEEQEGRAEAYRQIADELESVDSTYVTSVKYLEKELFVDCDGDDHEFPVLLMDWIDGETMDHYIAESRYDNYAMSMLCYRFCKMAAWLRSQPFAHGDIKPDNIMVRPDGSLTLIDYDGMFVPSMKCQTSPTIGTKDFSHPLRTKEDFDETIDDFSLATIALSLKAISLSPSLFDEYASADRLLFSADDYRDLSQSKVLTALHPLMTDSELNTLLSLFLLAHATKTLSMVSFRLFSVLKPEYIPAILSTKVTDEDLADAIVDDYGVKYSKDRKRLLDTSQNIKGEYRIRKGTICICDSAFWNCDLTTSIIIPEGVTEIGERAFNGCTGLTTIVIPDSVTEIGEYAFDGCTGLTSIVISNSVTKVGVCAFRRCTGLTSVVIPDSVTKIGECAFLSCTGLRGIVIPEGVMEIGERAFYDCTSLTSVKIPESVTEIGSGAFSGCACLTNISVALENPSYVSINNCCLSKDLRRLIFGCRITIIPEGCSMIERFAFKGSTDLTSIMIPNSVTEIGECAFDGCTGLTSVVIPDSVTEIGKCTFDGCTGLTSIVISNSVTKIGECAFRRCTGLTSVVIPDGITEIDHGAFRCCTGLTNIVIPDSVTKIGEGAFGHCTDLTNIMIPKGCRKIWRYTFEGCIGLTSVVIPEGVTEIGGSAFEGCTGLASIMIPDSVMVIGESAFYGCNLPPNVKTELIVKFGSGVFAKTIYRIYRSIH